MSRLDMIFVSGILSDQINSSKVDWSFDDSDHAMVESSFKIAEQFKKGPGMLRLNTDILDNEVIVEKIKQELELQIQQISEGWNPHFQLEFVKASIYSIFSLEASKKRKIENIDLQALNEQINHLKTTKEKLATGEITNPQLLGDIEEALRVLEEEHKTYLNEVSKKLSIRAKSKWFDEGERSNKYFLNIIKKQNQQTLITKLVSPNTIYDTQERIMEHLTQFYCSLYDEKQTDSNYDELLSGCPSLNDAEREYLD